MTVINKKIGISDYKQILNIIRENYNIDFSNYALTSLKKRIEKIYTLYNFISIEDFIKKIGTESKFFETFLFDISVPTTEMFRDPPMWLNLKEHVLPKYKKNETLNIEFILTRAADIAYSSFNDAKIDCQTAMQVFEKYLHPDLFL